MTPYPLSRRAPSATRPLLRVVSLSTARAPDRPARGPRSSAAGAVVRRVAGDARAGARERDGREDAAAADLEPVAAREPVAAHDRVDQRELDGRPREQGAVPDAAT